MTAQYIAGFFDGEGCVAVYAKKKQSFFLRTQLAQNKTTASVAMFQKLVERYGGRWSEQRSLSGRQKLNWQLSSDKAVAFLEEILPFLILKREQAVIAIEWQKQRPQRVRDARGRITSGAGLTLAKDTAVAASLKELKRAA